MRHFCFVHCLRLRCDFLSAIVLRSFRLPLTIGGSADYAQVLTAVVARVHVFVVDFFAVTLPYAPGLHHHLACGVAGSPSLLLLWLCLVRDVLSSVVAGPFGGH